MQPVPERSEGQPLLRNAFRLLSALTHPGFYPIWIGITVWGNSRSHLIAFLCLALLPFAGALIYFRLAGEKDVFVIERRNRIIPLLMSILGGFVLLVLHETGWYTYFPPPLLLYLIGLQIVVLLITFFWKISLHMTGLGFLCTLAAVYEPGPAGSFFLALTALSLLVAWARYYLGSHDLPQLLAGSLLGILWMCLGILLFE